MSKDNFLVDDHVVVMGGGTGTPKLLRGLVEVVNPEKLTIIANTADDWKFYGLHVSPDIDSMLYVLSGLLDESKWWGIRGDTFKAVELLKNRFREDVWFNLGDQDMVTCLYRTFLLQEGYRLTQATQELARRLGIIPTILPMTDDRIQSIIVTKEHGPIHIEEYFVKYRCQPQVLDVTYDEAIHPVRAPSEVMKALDDARYIILGPSNPVTSIGPIIHVPDIQQAMKANNRAKKIAISPIIGSKPVSGPTGHFLRAWNVPVTPVGVASLYEDLITYFVLHHSDQNFAPELRKLALEPIFLDILIPNKEDAVRLSRELFAHVA